MTDLDRRISARLAAFGWTDTLDDYFAEEIGCAVEDVANVRREHETEIEARKLALLVEREAVARRVEELAELSEWAGSRDALLVRVLDAALARVKRRKAKQVSDCGRSADRVVSRSRSRAEASEGVSGRKDPDTTATARSRGVPGAQATGFAEAAGSRQRVPAQSGGVGLGQTG